MTATPGLYVLPQIEAGADASLEQLSASREDSDIDLVMLMMARPFRRFGAEFPRSNGLKVSTNIEAG
jgi:hypothetical protein